MGTTIRPEVSTKNIYRLEKHRYYELKHFCMQYPIWKKAYIALDGFNRSSTVTSTASNVHGDPTANCAEARLYYLQRMEIIEQAAIATDPDMATYILKAVAEGTSYDYVKARLEIPCCREVYYELYRRFFWLLNKTRN